MLGSLPLVCLSDAQESFVGIFRAEVDGDRFGVANCLGFIESHPVLNIVELRR